MKSTGVIRQVDELGRFVLPIEIRRSLGINVRDSLEIHTEGNRILLTKHEDCCIFCGAVKSLTTHEGKCICAKCLTAIKAL